MSRSARRVAVILVVALTERLLADAPRLARLAGRGALVRLDPPLPAVTCTSQASMVTGLAPSGHGIVANGWYVRDLAEVLFWRQSNRLVQGERLWEAARRARPGTRTAKLFWWFNMYADVERSVTPRPHYPADGRKIPGVYAEPPELGEALERTLGRFPLFEFWGPRASIRSSAWIADSARHVARTEAGGPPELLLCYLPHLDYALQREGPRGQGIPREVRAIDAVAGSLAEELREAHGYDVLVCSEYGIEAVDRPVHVNRALREAGLLRVRRSPWTGEQLDAGASRAFAVSDHQIAHVYVRDGADVPIVAERLRGLPGVGRVAAGEERAALGLDHERSGEVICLADRGAFFTYYFWLDDAVAPDYAPTVDIHRKPGYDPAELFLRPGALTQARVIYRLAQKKLGLRALLDVIPTDASLVRGSHGLEPGAPEDAPLLIHPRPPADMPARMPMTSLKETVLDLLLREDAA